MNYNPNDYIFNITNDSVQIGGYNLNNELADKHLFKTYSLGKNTLTVPAGLYMINNKNNKNQEGGFMSYKNDYYTNKEHGVVENGLFEKLEQLVSVNHKLGGSRHFKTQKKQKKKLKKTMKKY